MRLRRTRVFSLSIAIPWQEIHTTRPVELDIFSHAADRGRPGVVAN